MKQVEPSKTIAVADAAGLWRLYGFNDPSELVLEDLALVLGVVVLEGPLDTADARLIRKESRGLIRVKKDIPEAGRRRFAVAHELGHWRLHKNVSQVLACTSEDMVAKYKASAPEVEANYFAAELLMPETLFLPRVRGVEPSFDLIKDQAAFFQTTLTATAIRFAELSEDYCAVIVSEQGKIRWWRGSEKFEENCWVECGSALALKTVAGSYFAGEGGEPGPVELPADQWLSRWPDDEDASVIEESILLGHYGQVLSLIRLV